MGQANTPEDPNAAHEPAEPDVPQDSEQARQQERAGTSPEDAPGQPQGDPEEGNEPEADREGTALGVDGSVADVAGVEAQPGSAPGTALPVEDDEDE